MNIRAYIPAFILLCGIYVLHELGLRGWYAWYYYDIMMHFIGGAWVAATAYWVYYRSGKWGAPRPTWGGILLVTCAAALIVGIGWEIFEYIAGLTEVHPLETWRADITRDIIMDTLGAVAVASYYIYRTKTLSWGRIQLESVDKILTQ